MMYYILILLLVFSSLSLCEVQPRTTTNPSCLIELTNYSHGSNYTWFGKVSNLKECQERCFSDEECVAVSFCNYYSSKNCALYTESQSRQGRSKQGWSSYQERNDGEDWRKDCNTCKCEKGTVLCTTDTCDGIGGKKSCTCINPFKNNPYDEHIGDPSITCAKKNNPYCYVDCKADCTDIRAARGRGRCFSMSACPNRVEQTNGCMDEPGIKRMDGETWKKDCNSCSCRGSTVSCTKHHCGCMDENDKERFDGETWKKNCNTCRCKEGTVSCTNDPCPETLCVCENDEEQNGNCGPLNGSCKVDCKANCRDKTEHGGKCYSTFACLDDKIAALESK